jgi:hypothetical protein
MSKNATVCCSICNRPLRTVRAASIALRNAPLVCRYCFGEQSYGGASKRWTVGRETEAAAGG